MTDSADTPSGDLKRIPGLFRRWELPEIFEANRDYHIEDAGVHADGTSLVALYACEIEEGESDHTGDGTREVADPKGIIPENLLPRDMVAALPLDLGSSTVGSEPSTPLPLFSHDGATVGDLREAIVEAQQSLKADGRKLQALSLLYQELLAHGAPAEAGVSEMLGIIAIADGDTARCFGSVPAPASHAPILHSHRRAAGTFRSQPE
jgi:hypothetical protein